MPLVHIGHLSWIHGIPWLYAKVKDPEEDFATFSENVS